jgi:hypothetical protein
MISAVTAPILQSRVTAEASPNIEFRNSVAHSSTSPRLAARGSNQAL